MYKTEIKMGLIVSFLAFNCYTLSSQENRRNQKPRPLEEIRKQLKTDEDGYISQEELEKAAKPNRWKH